MDFLNIVYLPMEFFAFEKIVLFLLYVPRDGRALDLFILYRFAVFKLLNVLSYGFFWLGLKECYVFNLKALPIASF